MTEGGKIYYSLDEARAELKKRWADLDLRKRVEVELGHSFMPIFKDKLRGVSFRQLCSPDNGFTFFYQCAKYVGTEPLVLEYHDDIFVHFNEEKKGLGRLRLTTLDGAKKTVDIMDFHAAEKMPLKDIKIKTGESLVEFHHELFRMSSYDIELHENSEWFHSIGKAKDYYYHFLLHFVAHGVLFETFSVEEREKGEAEFVSNIVVSNIERIEKHLGIRPIVVRSYPDDQSDSEDLYWWSYPGYINNHLVKLLGQ